MISLIRRFLLTCGFLNRIIPAASLSKIVFYLINDVLKINTGM